MTNNLQKDLYRAADEFFGKMGGVLTPADKPRLTELVEQHMLPWELDEVIINLDDENEFIDITVRNGLKTASVSLQWKDASGNTWVRIDTDGDGK